MAKVTSDNGGFAVDNVETRYCWRCGVEFTLKPHYSTRYCPDCMSLVSRRHGADRATLRVRRERDVADEAARVDMALSLRKIDRAYASSYRIPVRKIVQNGVVSYARGRCPGGPADFPFKLQFFAPRPKRKAVKDESNS